MRKEFFVKKGFLIIEDVFTNEETDKLLAIIESADSSLPTFRKTNDLFAIRQFLKEIPVSAPLIFTDKLNSIIESIVGEGYFVVKSIYFDKPDSSNWFVSYHQDLTISVDKKRDITGFGPWTVKQNQYAVQPPLEFLQDNFTIRIHLDDTTIENGALRIIPESQQKGIYRPETIDWNNETELDCPVKKGGVMFMKPLLLHSSGRTTNNQRRRVIHIEFSRQQLPCGIQWSEFLNYKNLKDYDGLS
jgi:ectoine hydroxylase-related dioxygenase (phytanoyl-CoA dioxygenase family)